MANPPTSPTVHPPPAPNSRSKWIIDPAVPDVVVVIDSRLNDPDNHDNWVNVEFDLPPKKRLPAGGWTLRLSNPGANPVPFDCWIERPDDYTQPFLTFTSHATDRKTVTIPGTAAGAITVGAYAQEPHQGKNPGAIRPTHVPVP